MFSVRCSVFGVQGSESDLEFRVRVQSLADFASFFLLPFPNTEHSSPPSSLRRTLENRRPVRQTLNPLPFLAHRRRRPRRSPCARKVAVTGDGDDTVGRRHELPCIFAETKAGARGYSHPFLDDHVAKLRPFAHLRVGEQDAALQLAASPDHDARRNNAVDHFRILNADPARNEVFPVDGFAIAGGFRGVQSRHPLTKA